MISRYETPLAPVVAEMVHAIDKPMHLIAGAYPTSHEMVRKVQPFLKPSKSIGLAYIVCNTL